MPSTYRRQAATICSLLTLCLLGTGCATPPAFENAALAEVPHELRKVTMPPYVIEPPDEILLSATRLVPKPPYKAQALDLLGVTVPSTIVFEPPPAIGASQEERAIWAERKAREIAGAYQVSPEGYIELGSFYGRVYGVIGKRLDEIKTLIEQYFQERRKMGLLAPPDPITVQVTLVESRALQQIQGSHLVRPDGVVVLGVYGQVYIAGMTLPEARAAIEAHMTQYLENPEISVDIIGINSKVYYIISDQAGYGQGIVRLPLTGNETVLDALAQIGGVPSVGSMRKIWIARPVADDVHGEQILYVDYEAIAKHGLSATNYQLLPGDRLYIHADGYIVVANWLDKRLAPLERIMGFTLLVNGLVKSLASSAGNNGNNFGGGFF
jgi:polysaccharide export outer membrane protein